MAAPSLARVVLASTSPYRRELLQRLKLPFETVAPDVDERPAPDEMPESLALRLAQAKAAAVTAAYPDHLIIGSDQVAVGAASILDKPGTYEKAFAQLTLMRGRNVAFHTAVCLIDSCTGRVQADVVTINVRMRDYSDAQIERYLKADEPYDCAGSARIESLGISLVEKFEGDDPTALIGLPLIALCKMLRNEGIELP